jgi:hypothetical protein
MKTTVRTKTPTKAKPGQLRSAHIEYDSEGDGATTTHMHEPEPGKKNDPWTPGPAPHKKSFSTRMEAHHHMAKMAGVNSEMGNEDVEGDPDEDQNEDQGQEPNPGAAPQAVGQ